MAAFAAMKSLKRKNPEGSLSDVMRDVGHRAQSMTMAKKIKSTTLSLVVGLASAEDEPAKGDKPASIKARVYVVDVHPIGASIPRVRVEEAPAGAEEIPLITIDPAGAYFDVNVAVEHRPNMSKPQVKGRYPKDDVFHRLDKPVRLHRNQSLLLFVNGALGSEVNGEAQGAILGGLSYETFTTKEGRRGYAWRASVLNVMTDAPSYASAYTSRLRYIFPYAHQLLPVPANLGRLLHGYDLAALQAAQTAKNKDYDIFGYTLPVFRLEVAQIGGRYRLPTEQYLLTEKTKGQGMSAALAEPLAMCRHVTMEQQPTPPATTRLMFGTDQFEVLRLLVTMARVQPSASSSTTEVKEEAAAAADDDGTAQVEQILVESKIFAHHLINAPCLVPSWNAALTGGTATRPPMPFTLLLKPDPVRSFGDTRVMPDAPDGILNASIERLVFEFRRYVLQYGIPVSADVVTKALFAPGALRGSCFDETLGTDDTVETIAEDAFPAGKFADYQKMAVVNYGATSNDEGVVVLDVAAKLNFAHRAWSTPGLRFFVVPLTDDVAVPLEVDPEADPLGKLAAVDPDFVPQRCALRTPEAGHAHLLAALKAAQVFKADATDLVAACKDPLRPFVVDYAVERNRDLVRDDLRDPTKKFYMARPYFITVAVFPREAGSADGHCIAVDLADKIESDYGQHRQRHHEAAVAIAAGATAGPAGPAAEDDMDVVDFDDA